MPVLPTKAAWARVQRAVRLSEQSRPGDFSPRRRPESTNYPLRVILLDNCVDESPTDAIITEIADSNEIQKLTIEGEPSGGTFRLTFLGKQTPPLAWNITPTN
ncbi:MAG: hypothetical protein NT069_23310, partial [Planctomycetota bacterium]|nr:hypothetical protein [Planctomycetota bacterium]